MTNNSAESSPTRKALLALASRQLERLRFPVKWCPHQPTAKQAEFLATSEAEVLFGGAAGGGKSDAILMAALQYVDHPAYSAIIFRRTYPQLTNSVSGLIPRSQGWLRGKGAAWNEQKKTWTFPSGAQIQFGHLQHENDKYNYQGGEYHFIGYDELTHFTETQYTYMLSRLRRKADAEIPTRVRGSANPGGEGHEWVKKRFVPEAFVAERGPEKFGRTWAQGGRAFVPAKLEDNRHLDIVDYERSLAELDPITRAQLRHGDWSTFEGGRYKRAWFRSFTRQGELYRLWVPGAATPKVVAPWDCILRFITADPAGTSAEKAAEKRGKPPSYTAIGVWEITPDFDLLCLDVRRFRAEYPDVLAAIIATQQQWNAAFIGIENASTGVALLPELSRQGFNVRPLSPAGKDKLTRAADALNRAEQGKVYVPAESTWKDEFLAELVGWTGHPDEVFDQGDCLSYAGSVLAEEASNRSGGFVPWVG